MTRQHLTDRLVLRSWKPSDLVPLHELNQDSEVMVFFPRLLNLDECQAMITRMQAGIDADGFGFWAIEEYGSGALLGLAGLSRPRFDAAFTPCVEIGWRLRRDAWGRGYATEAARKALDIGFTQFKLPEIVAFTVPQNKRSRRVMEKLGMTHNKADDFKHPSLAENHRLSDHVLYRLPRHLWRRTMIKSSHNNLKCSVG